jgi:glycosyltransferase involved in cell wall biosynthesis
VAQWIERKGILDLVEAWRMVEAPNASLRLVGETDADPEYHSRVMEAIGEDSSIIVSGKLDDESLAVVYADSDFFALPSRFEGYGIVYAEALSFGLPVVAYDVGPVPELVGGEAGVFVPPRDEAGLSREIGNLLSDGELRCRMSGAALRRAGNLPRWEDTVRGFAEVLREVERG